MTTNVLVTINPTPEVPGWPVFGMLMPFSAGWGDQRSSRNQIGCLCEDGVQLGIVGGARPVCRRTRADGSNRTVHAAKNRWSKGRSPDFVFFQDLQRLLA